MIVGLGCFLKLWKLLNGAQGVFLNYLFSICARPAAQSRILHGHAVGGSGCQVLSVVLRVFPGTQKS